MLDLGAAAASGCIRPVGSGRSHCDDTTPGHSRSATREDSVARTDLINDFTRWHSRTALPRAATADEWRQPYPGQAIALHWTGHGPRRLGLVPVGRVVPLAVRWARHTAGRPGARVRVLKRLHRDHRHVSAERVLSGPGLSCCIDAVRARRPEWPSVERRAINRPGALDRSGLCRETLTMFCAWLGTVAGGSGADAWCRAEYLSGWHRAADPGISGQVPIPRPL